MHLDQRFGDRQTDPRLAQTGDGGTIGPREALKDPGLVLRGYASPCIGHRHEQVGRQVPNPVIALLHPGANQDFGARL
jgi:hypothetical protein